jgi:hypothetical protein
MTLHSDTLFWFRANQSMLFLLNAACLEVKQPMPIVLSEPGLELTIYRTRDKHANHYATDAVFEFIIGMYMYLLLLFLLKHYLIQYF